MAAKALPSQEALRQLLRYEPETGRLFWLERPVRRPNDVTWNKKFSGKQAFTSKSKDGYHKGGINDVRVYAHRVIWKMETGCEPEFIDHENGDRSDNRWANLRSVRKTENSRNARKSSRNSSGVIGVHKHKTKWVAEINDGIGQRVYLGIFNTIEEAAGARKVAEKQFGYHENHGRAA
ncbi:HNH endonuclease [Agrobacterium salinitolerans]|uniref:HNH endonuclease n=1 Tax=Agrobacterium salinitolerans TaxID=1183413 RepID=UPI0022B83B7A|nr:HNH endonuclease [Agrobacterium salinitolerans]MCZ7856007.1 HNH endonuclease [Agrobacterium salinitolerans]